MSVVPSELAIGVFGTFGEAQSTLSNLQSVGFNAARVGLVVRTDIVEAAEEQAGGRTRRTRDAVIDGQLFAGLTGGEPRGTLTRGLVDALVELGIFEDEATDYKNEFVAGRALVVVRADGRHSEALDVLRRHHPSTLATHCCSQAAWGEVVPCDPDSPPATAINGSCLRA